MGSWHHMPERRFPFRFLFNVLHHVTRRPNHKTVVQLSFVCSDHEGSSIWFRSVHFLLFYILKSHSLSVKSFSEVNIKFPLRVLHVGIGTKARLFLLRLHVACVGNAINRFPPNFSKFHLKSQNCGGQTKIKNVPPEKGQPVDRFTWKCRFYGCVNRQIDE